MDNEALKSLNVQQCSPQWKALLGFFSQELADQLTTKNLRTMLRNSGTQFAKQHALPNTDTLIELHVAINAQWQALNWGWASITEVGNQLHIKHYFSPLLTAMGSDNMSWTTGFLEGVYEQWLRQSGAEDDQLRLSQRGRPDELGTVEFSFGK